jgi:FAD/FMN-containing dehydrogenase
MINIQLILELVHGLDIAGHAVGGGQGFLSRLYGLLSDNILEMKAVNAQGKSIFYQVVKMSISFR